MLVWHNDLRRLRRHEPGNTRKRIRTVSVELILPPTLPRSLILLQLRPHDINLEHMINNAGWAIMACLLHRNARHQPWIERRRGNGESRVPHVRITLSVDTYEWLVLRLTKCAGVERATVRSDLDRTIAFTERFCHTGEWCRATLRGSPAS